MLGRFFYAQNDSVSPVKVIAPNSRCLPTDLVRKQAVKSIKKMKNFGRWMSS